MPSQTETLMKRVNERIYNMADLASKDWFRRQSQDTAQRMYFYYKPGEIVFHIGTEPLNDDWELAWNDRISIGSSQRQVCQQLVDIAKKLPIIPEDF